MVCYFGIGGLKIPHLAHFFGKNIDRWAYGGGGGTQNPGVEGAHRAQPPHAQCLKTLKNRQPGLKYYFTKTGAEPRSDYDCKPSRSAEKNNTVRKTLL